MFFDIICLSRQNLFGGVWFQLTKLGGLGLGWGVVSIFFIGGGPPNLGLSIFCTSLIECLGVFDTFHNFTLLLDHFGNYCKNQNSTSSYQAPFPISGSVNFYED